MGKQRKTDLIFSVSSETGISKKEAGVAVDSLMGAIKGGLKSGNNVIIKGFGTFSVNERAAREGKNPATGATIQIQASKQVKFKAGKGLKERVNC